MRGGDMEDAVAKTREGGPGEVYTIRPIGYIQSPARHVSGCPKQGREGELEGRLVIYEAYLGGLLGIREGQWVTVLYWMHLADRTRLRVHPRGDHSLPLRGVFATRSPHRPNPIAVDDVLVLGVEGNVVHVRGIDAVDGTPLIDMKVCLKPVPGDG